MPKTLAEKLRIKEGMSLLTIHAPADFEHTLETAGLRISPKAKDYHQVHWFVTSQQQLEKEVEKAVKLLKNEVICWIYYPKLTSKIQTNLTRDKGWDALLSHKELQWLSLVSFDDTWSAFAMRLKTSADKKKESQPKVREIFKYVDPVKKTVQLPSDLHNAFKKDTLASTLFDKLSFTNKKEYIEWIITAKREETRKQRVEGTIERLHNGWKNPRNM